MDITLSGENGLATRLPKFNEHAHLKLPLLVPFSKFSAGPLWQDLDDPVMSELIHKKVNQ
jgi:hypothetical protein